MLRIALVILFLCVVILLAGNLGSTPKTPPIETQTQAPDTTAIIPIAQDSLYQRVQPNLMWGSEKQAQMLLRRLMTNPDVRVIVLAWNQEGLARTIAWNRSTDTIERSDAEITERYGGATDENMKRVARGQMTFSFR